MSSVDIIRAWKDDEFRKSLSPEQQALLPENPANRIELADADLDQMQGGSIISLFPPCTLGDCLISIWNTCVC